MTVSVEEIAEAKKFLAETEKLLSPTIERDTYAWDDAHRAITALLVGFPSPGVDEGSAELRSATYLDAVGDLPSWPVVKACKLWNRKQAGQQHDYRWAPTPPILRGLAEKELHPAKTQAEKLRNLISAAESRPTDYRVPEVVKLPPAEADPEAIKKPGHVAGHAARVMEDLARKKAASADGEIQ